jgi:holo-[acyl-carrier protein] synthase
VLGIGIDLVDIDRFRTVLARTPGMIERLFTDGETAYADLAEDPTARLAVRFAAKEATLKCLGLGLGGMRMSEIEVVRHDDGHPELVLHGDAIAVAKEHDVARWLITLSHTHAVAQATVVALGS